MIYDFNPTRNWYVKTDDTKFTWYESNLLAKPKLAYSSKKNDVYYYELPGVKKELISVDITDGWLNVIATGKVGDKEYSYDFSTLVGDASIFDINCTFENSVLMVEMKKKISKTTIEVKG